MLDLKTLPGPDDLWQMDRDHALHPWTNFGPFERDGALVMERGEGCWLWDAEGRRYFDAVGGMWCTNIGLGRREIAETMAEQAATSAAQLASLGEAFELGTRQLAASHEQLVQSLHAVQAAIDQSLSRSDEQLAYYVAQAREVIDLSISAQQGIIEDLRGLKAPARASAGVA